MFSLRHIIEFQILALASTIKFVYVTIDIIADLAYVSFSFRGRFM